MNTAWVDRRVAEVTVRARVPSRRLGIDQRSREQSAGAVVVNMKIRCASASDWNWLKDQFGKWVNRGVDGRFVAREEAEYPRWYRTYNPVVT